MTQSLTVFVVNQQGADVGIAEACPARLQSLPSSERVARNFTGSTSVGA